MSKIEKKKEKLNERIAALEFELKNNLQKKSQGTAMNIQVHHQKIMELKKQLFELS